MSTVEEAALLAGMMKRIAALERAAGRHTAVTKGASTARPTPAASATGVMYLDTTLDPDGLPIWWQGTKWIKADGTDA